MSDMTEEAIIQLPELDENSKLSPLEQRERQLSKQIERNNRLDAELDRGDSWIWIRSKFEKCRTQFKWHKPRADSLSGTRYEVMGWLHVLFAHADPQVYIDITMEHQKKADDAIKRAEEAERKGGELCCVLGNLGIHVHELGLRSVGVMGKWTYRNERAEIAEAELARLKAERDRPETEDFFKGISLEAAHQRARWGTDHDTGKQPADWFWLVGYLAGKCLASHIAGNQEKALHHTISTAAVLANWHMAIKGAGNMRPGIEEPQP